MGIIPTPNGLCIAVVGIIPAPVVRKVTPNYYVVHCPHQFLREQIYGHTCILHLRTNIYICTLCIRTKCLFTTFETEFGHFVKYAG